MTPTQQYAALEEGSPVVQFVHQGSQCAGGLIFLTPRDSAAGMARGMILDANGTLVWNQAESLRGLNQRIQHLKAQKHRGETYLTYWMGNNELYPPVGARYMLDISYRVRHQIQPFSYPAADKHEFHVTQDGTAIVIVYSPVLGDLSPVGGASGWVLDGIFQEIDIETGALLFEWHALQQFPLNAT
ncbi:hypothetical protein BP00DRAFT_414659 [Aspergillus indologenus CBS 114.80]|uniref:Uncharacterized protein n=1 Tax=Aspergillus indologenus CBS 114.80 TaxID=1450541 RepID=A0A2V5IUW5_9EURO|nr:hypothetical protein BP00DRAFT_414659 [Aspergillus indologenus CBS 114.80]